MSGLRVLVTDGEQRAALALVRSLGRAGHDISVCSPRPNPLAGASRHVDRVVHVPDPLAGPEQYADAVEDVVRTDDTDFLIPMTEPSLLAILPARDRGRFQGVNIPFCETAAFERASDKDLVTRKALELGIHVPTQHPVEEKGSDPAPEGWRYPVVLKPHRSVVGSGANARKLTVVHAADPASARRALEDLPAEAYPVLVQERIIGPGTGIFLLLWDGSVRAEFAHRRIREKPPSGGVSVYRESIPAPPDLVERSAELLRTLGCYGVAMVEYKIDGATGRPYLMEINCRFWGSLQLAIDAGVDFPTLLLDAAMGHPSTGVPGYRSGIRSRWLWGDADHLWARLKPGGGRDLPEGAPGRLRTLAQVALPWRPGDRTEVLRLGDPGPFLRETVQWFTRR